MTLLDEGPLEGILCNGLRAEVELEFEWEAGLFVDEPLVVFFG